MVQRTADVGIIGNRAYQRHTAGSFRFDALAHQCRCIYQQSRRDTFIEAMTLEVTCTMGNLHQLGGDVFIYAGFLGNNLDFDILCRVIKIQRACWSTQDNSSARALPRRPPAA